MKNCHWNYETMPQVATGMNLEESYTNQVSQSRKDNSILSPFYAKWRKRCRGTNLQHRDSEQSNRKWPLPQNVKGQGWARNSGQTYTQESVSLIDDPQAVSPTSPPPFLPSTYTKKSVSLTYIEICICNRKSTRIISFLPHMQINQYLQLIIHKEYLLPCSSLPHKHKICISYREIYIC